MQASSTSWKNKPFKDGVPLRFRGEFDDQEFALLREGFIPKQMEDKWFIYYEEPHLFLHRSWTGQPVYRVTLRGVQGGAEVTEALWSSESARVSPSGQGAEYQVQMLDFLLSVLLLGRSKPFPMPPNVQEPSHGVFQHIVSGTGYPETPSTISKKPWWRFW